MNVSRWLVCFLVVLFVAASFASAAQNPERERLEVQKLQEEIETLRSDRSVVGQLPAYGAILTALVGIGGLLAAVMRNLADRRAEHEAARTEQEREREARERESVRRFDEHFGATVERLGSGDSAARANGAASTVALLKPEHAAFHEQVFEVLLANTKFPRGDHSDAIVSHAFAAAARVYLPRLRESTPDASIDLCHAWLRDEHLAHVDLRGSRLMHADLTGADLTGAKLDEAWLNDATLIGAQFGGARLVSARFRYAKASRAFFCGASLQGAHFHHTDLSGAKFAGATLSDAIFTAATFDDVALRGISQTQTWRKAKFDDDIRERLEGMAPAPV